MYALDDHSYSKNPRKCQLELTPRKVAMKKVIKRQKTTIYRLRRRRCQFCKRKQPHVAAKNVDHLMSAITAQLSASHKHLAEFVGSQIRLCSRHKYGRRYT
jgi:hypothetical protein